MIPHGRFTKLFKVVGFTGLLKTPHAHASEKDFLAEVKSVIEKGLPLTYFSITSTPHWYRKPFSNP